MGVGGEVSRLLVQPEKRETLENGIVTNLSTEIEWIGDICGREGVDAISESKGHQGSIYSTKDDLISKCLKWHLLANR